MFFDYKYRKGGVQRQGWGDSLYVFYNAQESVPPLQEAFLKALGSMMNKVYPRTPCILFSGGLDSELMITGLQKLGYLIGQDFHVRHAVYDGPGNRHDTEQVAKYSDVEYIGMPTEDYYRSTECFEFCVTHGISYVTMTPVARLMMQTCADGMYPVIGHGDPQIYVGKEGTIYHYDFEYQMTWQRIVRQNGLHAMTDFYRSTSDLYRAYVREYVKRAQPQLEELKFMHNAVPTIKHAIFGHTERKKWTGHEHYRTREIEEINKRIQLVTGYSAESSFFRKPLEQFDKDWFY